MARPTSKDPLDTFRWIVEIDDIGRSGFSSIQTPSYTITTRDYREGGQHLNPLQIVNTLSYDPIILERGVTSDEGFLKWAQGPIEILGSSSEDEDSDNIQNYRRDVLIAHIDRTSTRIREYKLINAFPISYKPASNFNASTEEVSIESITLAYEGFQVITKGKVTDSLSIKNIFQKLSRNSF